MQRAQDARQSRNAWKLRAHLAERRVEQLQRRPPKPFFGSSTSSWNTQCQPCQKPLAPLWRTECNPCMPAAARVTKTNTRAARTQNQHKAKTRDGNRNEVISGKGGYREPLKLVVIPQHLFDNARFYAQLVNARAVNAKRLGVIAKPTTRAKTKRRDCDFCSPEELERALCSAKVDAARACTIDDLSRALCGSESEARSQGGGNFDETCLLYTSPSPRDVEESRMASCG